MRRLFLVLWLLALLAGCAASFDPTSYTLDQGDLQRLVDRQFPLERRVLEVLNVSVSAPRLQLLGDRNRLATVLDVAVRDRLFGGRWHGRLELNSQLRYAPGDQTVRLLKVRVDEFTLDKADSPASAQVERVAALVAEGMLEDLVIYRLSPERLARIRSHGLEPGSVAITARGVQIKLVPAGTAAAALNPPPL